jgi:hypothetical protein
MHAKKVSGGGVAAAKGGAKSVKNKNIKSIDAKIAKAVQKKQTMQSSKKRLLDTLNNLPLYKTNGINSKDILNEQRNRNKEMNLEVEMQAKKQALLEFMEAIKPVKYLISSNEMTRMIRDGKEDELDAKLAVLQQKNDQK